jgi:hypothetical protein
MAGQLTYLNLPWTNIGNRVHNAGHDAHTTSAQDAAKHIVPDQVCPRGRFLHVKVLAMGEVICPSNMSVSIQALEYSPQLYTQTQHAKQPYMFFRHVIWATTGLQHNAPTLEDPDLHSPTAENTLFVSDTRVPCKHKRNLSDRCTLQQELPPCSGVSRQHPFPVRHLEGRLRCGGAMLATPSWHVRYTPLSLL